MLTLYDFKSSGNGYKVRLLLHQLRLPFIYVETNILKGESRTPQFLEMNPNGKVPTLALGDGRYLAESNAILLYLAEGQDFYQAILGNAAKCTSGYSLSNIAMSQTLQPPDSGRTICEWESMMSVS